MDFEIREAHDDDAWELVGLVAGCWSEYPGCILDVHGEAPELLAIATAYRDRGGSFWVAEAGGRVVGSAGLVPGRNPMSALLQKLYVARGARGRGLASRLLSLVEAEATAGGAVQVELWTDTRFAQAHRFYERRGYARSGATRELHDLSNSLEYHYRKDVKHA